MNSDNPILLVEDEEVDAMAVQRAFKTLKITNALVHVRDGEEALDYLKTPENKQPCLILLDLRMPRMDGIEFLKIAKNDSSLKRLPVVVFTTSSEERDKVDTYNLGVAGYLVKPTDYHKFIEVIRTIDLYWTLCEQPDGY